MKIPYILKFPFCHYFISGNLGNGNIWKFIRQLVFLPFCLIYLSCNQADSPMGGVIDKTDSQNPLYLSLKISVPSTRSTTDNSKPGDSSEGTIDGEINENKINSANVYFFDSDTGEFLYSFTANNENSIREKGNSTFNIVTELKEDPLRKLVGRTFNIYIIGNPVSAPATNNEASFLDSSISITGLDTYPVRAFGSGTEGQLCPAANIAKYPVNDLASYTNTENLTYAQLRESLSSIFSIEFEGGYLWEIGKNLPLELERQVARIDFRDYKEGSYLYKLESAVSNASNYSAEDVYLKIISLQLFNIDQESYNFRHIQPLSTVEGGSDGTLQAFGREKGSETGLYNWIADSNWSKKISSGSTITYFNQMRSSVNSDGLTSWNFTPTNIKDSYITTAELKAWLETNKKGSGEYCPWYYVTENTVSSTDLMTLQFATGIAIKVMICDANGKALKVESNKDLVVTMMPEGDFKVIKYQNSLKDPNDTEKELEPAGYYLTYKYMIEHNLVKTGTVNGGNGSKIDYAPMQIGVVRNNVYRIQVKGFTRLPDPDFGADVFSYVIPWDLRVDDEVFLK